MNTLLSEGEFISLIEEFDDKLSRDRVSIPNRPLFAFNLFCRKLHFVAPLGSCMGTPVEGLYTADNIESHIKRWYHENYGRRMLGIVEKGEFVLLIRNDPWRVRVPVFWGKRAIDIRDCIVDFTKQYAGRLSSAEVNEINLKFGKFHTVFYRLGLISGKKFVPEANDDLNIAVHTLMCAYPLSSLSKWHSLQFVEKLIKSYLFESGIVSEIEKMNKGHKLSTYNNLAASDGVFERIDQELLNKIQCTAGVRYDNTTVKLQQALEAHHASLDACAHVISQFERRFPKLTTSSLQ